MLAWSDLWLVTTGAAPSRPSTLVTWPCPKCCDEYFKSKTTVDQNKVLIETLSSTNESLRKWLDKSKNDFDEKQKECDSLRERMNQLQTRVTKLESDCDGMGRDKSGDIVAFETAMNDLKDLGHLKTDMRRLLQFVMKTNALFDFDDFDAEYGQDSEDDESDDVQPDGTLLIGDSIIRSVKSTVDDLKIHCISGSKLCDVRKFIAKVNPKKTKFSKIFIVCGTNDVATKRTPEKIVQEFDTVLKRAKEIAD